MNILFVRHCILLSSFHMPVSRKRWPEWYRKRLQQNLIRKHYVFCGQGAWSMNEISWYKCAWAQPERRGTSFLLMKYVAPHSTFIFLYISLFIHRAPASANIHAYELIHICTCIFICTKILCVILLQIFWIYSRLSIKFKKEFYV